MRSSGRSTGCCCQIGRFEAQRPRADAAPEASAIAVLIVRLVVMPSYSFLGARVTGSFGLPRTTMR